MLRPLTCLVVVLCVTASSGRRLHKRQTDANQTEPVVVPARPPPRPLLTPVSPQLPVQQAPLPPQEQPQQFQQPLGLPQQPSVALQNPTPIQPLEAGPALLQLPQQPQLAQGEWRRVFVPRRNFAPGFESRPVPQDLSLNQPKIQWFGAQQQQRPFQQQNLPVIQPQLQQGAKADQLRFSGVPPPDQQQPQAPDQQQPQTPEDPQELRQRIQEQAIQTQINNAGRDREAFLARVNVTGNQDSAKEFIRQLKNLSQFQEQQPFANVEVMKALINAEIQLAVDNWLTNEEVAGQLAATFTIPRESVSSAFALTPADVDEIHIAGNNPTAAKTFHVHLQELVWKKIDQQYRITTDMLATLSDAFLGLLVGNGVVKDKFADDIAAHFYRANSQKIKLF